MNMIAMFAATSTSRTPSRIPVSNESGAFFSPATRDIFMIILVALLIGVAAIVWAVYLRRQPRRDRRSPTIVEPTSNPLRRKHRRRKRKEPLTRKPTLAETGGLPPVKEKPSSPMQGL